MNEQTKRGKLPSASFPESMRFFYFVSLDVKHGAAHYTKVTRLYIYSKNNPLLSAFNLLAPEFYI